MRFALIAEGVADEPLVGVLARLCSRLGASEVEGESAYRHLTLVEAGREIERKVTALLDFDPDFDALFVHMDGDDEGLALRQQRVDDAMRRCGEARPYVRIVPVRMTESWLLADETLILEVMGRKSETAPRRASLGLPKTGRVEELARSKVKATLREALSRARRPPKHNKSTVAIDDREYARLRNQLLEELDIDGPVSELPSWRALVQDIEALLAELESTST